MNKNKIMSLLLAGALLVGGTFAGTMALFSDTATVSNPISITGGKVDIDAYGDDWNHYRNNDFNTSLGYGAEFSDVRPGDKFVKNIHVTNKSDYEVSLDIQKALQNVPEGFGNIVTLSHNNNTYLGKGATKAIRIEIAINNSEEAWKLLNGAQLNLDALYDITATQIVRE